MKTLYNASATARGGRRGYVESSNGLLKLDLSMPKELGGPGGSDTNPEQLFAAGYAACFENALRRVAGQQKEVTDASVTARVGIGRHPGGDAHEVCPYSRATQGNINVKLSVKT